MTEIYSQLLDTSPGYLPYVLPYLKIASVINAILVIITKNPVISVLYLIALFFNIAAYLIIIGIPFIGLSYLLVYVGAVSILFIFILMLINVRISELSANTNKTMPLVLIITIAFIYPVFKILPFNKSYTISNMFVEFYASFSDLNDNSIKTINNYKDISFINSSNWDSNLVDITDINSIGNIVYTNDAILLIIIGIILLLAMVGSIVITLKK